MIFVNFFDDNVHEYEEFIYIMVSLLKMPQSEEGLIPTLNHYGYMLETPDKCSQAFIDYASLIKGRVLDIGAAYGVNTIPALMGGAWVIANDLDKRHLTILKQRTPKYLLSRLILRAGKFPQEISIEKDSLDAVLASGVLHYLPGDEIEQAFSEIFKILKVGGKFFFFTSTPYIKLFRAFYPLYCINKKMGMKWPGMINNPGFYTPERKEHLPKTINLLDQETLGKLFEKVGFKIEKMEYVEMAGYPQDIHSEGQEYIEAMAIKT